jgi:ribonuclease P protein component
MERLKRRTDFRAAARGVKASGSAFVLQARRRADEGAVRVGFTVSRQVGNAVERNRVRRRLREMVRLADAGKLRAGHDYVLIGRRAALELPFAEMMRELDAALKQIHVREPGGNWWRTAAPPT